MRRSSEAVHRLKANSGKPLTIAIDGPAACGKSSVGGEVARRLGIRFLDTGAMYRAISWAALRRGIYIDDHAALASLAAASDIRLTAAPDGDRLLLDGADISGQLRSAAVDSVVAAVSAVGGVRKALVAQQRAIAAAGAVVMAGRDIGSVVLTDAALKVFLTASVETRAARRHAQQGEAPPDYHNVLCALRRRDKIDSERAESPLRPADDAVRICSDRMTLDDVVAKILSLVECRD